MRQSRGLLLLLVAVVVAAVVLFILSRQPSEPETPAVEPPEVVHFSADDVPVRSRDLGVSNAGVRVAIHPTFASWLVRVACDEPDGCAGEFAATVRYTGGGEEHSLALVGRFQASLGGDLRFEGLQEPPTVVDRVDQVVVEVQSRETPGAPVQDIEY